MTICAFPLYVLKRQKLGVCVSTLTAMLIFIAFLAYVAFQVVKNFQLRNLNVSLRKKDYDMVERLATMATSRRVLGDYTCDLYQLRARYLKKEPAPFEDMLQHMIAAPYKNPADKKSFLEQYYHSFLIQGKRTYAEWLLDGIRQNQDAAYIKYSEQAFAVMLDHRTDLIDEMIDEINGKQYYGFALGVILFMIAKQYEALGNDEKAALYYENAQVCFHPQAVYVPLLQSKLKQMEDAGLRNKEAHA